MTGIANHKTIATADFLNDKERIEILRAHLEGSEKYIDFLVSENKNLETENLILKTEIETFNEPCPDIKEWKRDWVNKMRS